MAYCDVPVRLALSVPFDHVTFEALFEMLAPQLDWVRLAEVSGLFPTLGAITLPLLGS